MSLEFQFQRVQSRIEASTELHFYGHKGYYKLNVVGFGATEAEAQASAALMLGQVQSALFVASRVSHETVATAKKSK